MAEEKGARHPAEAIAGILKTYTKLQNTQNELKAEIIQQRLKQNQDFAYDIMKQGMQNKMGEAKEKRMADYKANIATQKSDYEQRQERMEDVHERVPLEAKYERLMQLKSERELSPTEQAQFNILHKRVLGVAPKSVDISAPDDLSSEQQLQAAQIARRVGGVRGMKNIIPMVYEQMRQGKTMDDIEDNLRFASQSDKMTGTVRATLQNVIMGASPAVQERTMDFVDDALDRGNFDEVKSVIKRTVLSQAPVDQKNQIVGSERTLEFLTEIQNDLQDLEQQGINTNIFSGTLEEISSKIGTVKEPELRKMATKIKAAIQKYRRSMSGVAFSVPESKEYEQLFPGINKTGSFNTATINGLKETLTGDLENIYGLYMGKNNYNELFKKDSKQKSSESQPGGFTIISEETI